MFEPFYRIKQSETYNFIVYTTETDTLNSPINTIR